MGIPDVDTPCTVKVCSGHTLKVPCQRFAGTNDFCCLVIAVAEKRHYLQKFLAIYAKNGDDPNRVVQNSQPRHVSKPKRSTEYFHNTEKFDIHCLKDKQCSNDCGSSLNCDLCKGFLER